MRVLNLLRLTSRCSALACLILLAAIPLAQAQPGAWGQDLAVVAKGIQQLLTGRGEEAIAVGDFRGPAQIDTNFGPGFQQQLDAELRALKIRVDRKARLSVTGEYLAVQDKNHPGLIAVRFIARVFDDKGEVLTTLQVDLKATSAIGKILSPTVSLHANGTREDRNEQIKEKLAKPEAHVRGTQVAAAADSPYAVEVLVKSHAAKQAQARTPQLDGGQAYVEIRRDEMYEIKLHNYSKLEAAVTVHIDGLDAFTFSDVRNKAGRSRYSHFIVAPGSSMVVVGWHKHNQPPDNFLAFLVTQYGKGAASQTPQQAAGKVGVITVTFARAWTGKPPAEEGNARDASGNETGFGPPQSQAVHEVQRQIGVILDIVSIRYTR
jgi:hypothetical protein